MSLSIRTDPVFERLIPFLNSIDRRPVIIEIGVHWGQSTPMLWMSCRQPPYWYGFEPDPRNISILQGLGLDVFPFAISSCRERIPLILSDGRDAQGCLHTASSSLQQPTLHLEAHPWVKFEQAVEVDAVALDDIIDKEHAVIDLIWCDVQGAQRRVLAGATEVLARTRLLYIEVHPQPMYEDEPTFEELCALLPDWRVVERYEADVLFERVM